MTGATGFLGAWTVQALADQGFELRILARRDPTHPLWRGLDPEVVVGGLSDRAAIGRLCEDAEVVVHIAGLVKARDAAAFHAVNVDGARRVAEATAPDARMVLVSSLAAREAALSDYAASKRAGEAAASEVLGDRLTIVRPPAIYGPGDVELLPLFRLAARAPVLPAFDPAARIAAIHVADAARQIAELANRPAGGAVYALSDARGDGYGWREFVLTAAAAMGRAPPVVTLSSAIFDVAGAVGAMMRATGETPILTPGKARELRHKDWSIRPEERAPDLSPATFGLADGFADTVDWCRRSGLL